MKLGVNGPLVNIPLYRQRQVDVKIQKDRDSERSILLRCPEREGPQLLPAEIIEAPTWYDRTVQGIPITEIMTAHNLQLAVAVYEHCSLFTTGRQCQFCVMNHSRRNGSRVPVLKPPELIIEALEQIPVEEYGGLTLNGGMTLDPGRGMELIDPVVREVRQHYPNLPIAVEITPPQDMSWIDHLADSGVSSLMMNLECWSIEMREHLIPGKNELCPRDAYLRAFDRALKYLGPGRVSSCFVVGTESLESLKRGIEEVVSYGVIPSPLAGRFFEDIPDYPFVPGVNWREFLDVIRYAGALLKSHGISSTDKAGCVACGMCDLIKDVVP